MWSHPTATYGRHPPRWCTTRTTSYVATTTRSAEQRSRMRSRCPKQAVRTQSALTVNESWCCTTSNGGAKKLWQPPRNSTRCAPSTGWIQSPAEVEQDGPTEEPAETEPTTLLDHARRELATLCREFDEAVPYFRLKNTMQAFSDRLESDQRVLLAQEIGGRRLSNSLVDNGSRDPRLRMSATIPCTRGLRGDVGRLGSGFVPGTEEGQSGASGAPAKRSARESVKEGRAPVKKPLRPALIA